MTATAEETLRACLLQLQPLELLGMTLLKAAGVGQLPLNQQIPRTELQSAVLEIINYTTTCQKIAQQLNQLTPIPLITGDIPEFAL